MALADRAYLFEHFQNFVTFHGASRWRTNGKVCAADGGSLKARARSVNVKLGCSRIASPSVTPRPEAVSRRCENAAKMGRCLATLRTKQRNGSGASLASTTTVMISARFGN